MRTTDFTGSASPHLYAKAVTRRDLRPNDWAAIWPELAELSTTAADQPVGADAEGG